MSAATPPPASRGSFGSRAGFILAAAGSAIGLGNIWRFPYTAGENGGGAFVLVYLAFVALIGIPILLAELTLGRSTRGNPVGAFKRLFPKSWWPMVGGLGVLTGFGILAFYSVVAGWSVSYLLRAISGTFVGEFTAESSGALFTGLIADPTETVAMAAVFVLLTAAVVRGGVGGGIERASKVLMPMFLVILVLLAIRSLTLPGASKGIEFLFKPDFSKLSGTAVMSALGQALFSLSLGMGAMITYGSYLPKNVNLGSAGVAVAAADTLIAVLGGIIIFPALFSAGGSPGQGPGLVFVVLPTIFHHLPAGHLFAIAFYALLCIAALTSTISLLEVVVAYFVDERGWTRERAVWTVACGVIMLAVPSALSQGAVGSLTDFIAGQTFLDIQNILFGNVSLSVGALADLVVRWLEVGRGQGCRRARPDPADASQDLGCGDPNLLPARDRVGVHLHDGHRRVPLASRGRAMNVLLLDEAEISADGQAVVTGRRAEHVEQVLGKGPGDELVVGQIGAKLGRGTILELQDQSLRIECRFDREPPPKKPVHLVVALPRPPVLRRVLEHATAMGVDAITLLHTRRVEKSYWQSPALGEDKIAEHLQLGLEQAVDTVLPAVALERKFRPFVEDRLPAIAAGRRLLLAHPGPLTPPTEPPDPAVILVGPEGGFIDFERELLGSIGAEHVGLGPRILRVETAVTALLARFGLGAAP